MADELIYFGGAVKALDENGRIGGYLVRFTDAEHKDLAGEYFNADTYFGPRDGDGVDTLFHHAKGLPVEAKSLTPEVKDGLDNLRDHLFAPVTTKKDVHGIWAETVLDMADAYESLVFGMVKSDKLGWSSGAVQHLVRKEKDGYLKRWPIGEASLTPQPCEPLNRAVELKALDQIKFLSFSNPEPVKGVFEQELAEQTPSTWQLESVMRQSVGKVARAVASSDITGTTVDVDAQVTLILNEYVNRLKPLIVAQINDYAEEGGDDEFYLKTIYDDLEGDAPAASRFADHLQTVLAAAGEVEKRAKSIQELRVKSGRVLSASNRTRLSKLLESLKACGADIEALLVDTEPQKTVDPETMNSLLSNYHQMQFARVKAAVRR